MTYRNVKFGSQTKSKQIAMDKRVLEKSFITDLSKAWKNGEDYSENNVTFYNLPFKLTIMEQFFEDPSLTKNLLSDILNVDWSKKQMDLYHFRQSNDLSKLSSTFLKEFYEVLQNDVKPWIEAICDIKIKRVSASCSMYNNADYLLVHDDLLDDRQIAYVFYISPFDVTNWTKSMGGALEIFNVASDGYPEFPTIRQITPKDNQFVFFKVGTLSFHQVAEVTNLDYPRLTINGWFHGDVNKDLKSFRKPKITNLYREPKQCSINLSDWISPIYLERKTKQKIQNCIEMKSEISLEDFLVPDLFDEVCKELNNPSLKWSTRGPASSSNYNVLDADPDSNFLKRFIELLTSEEMFKLLHEYTALDLYGENRKTPLCTIEIQKLTKGSYSVLFDDSFAEDCKLNMFMYFNSVDDVGAITYLSHDDDGTYEDMNSDSALLTVYPQNNSLNLVYCTENQTHFTNYISKINSNLTKPVYRISCTYKE